MKRKILVLMVTALMVVLMVGTSASTALSQEPDAPRCDWYEAGFDRDFNNVWWAYCCHWSGYGWYLMGWWSEDTGYIPVY